MKFGWLARKIDTVISSLHNTIIQLGSIKKIEVVQWLQPSHAELIYPYLRKIIDFLFLFLEVLK